MIVNSTEIDIIKDLYNKNPKISAPKLNKLFENRCGKQISNKTMRRSLKKLNIHAYSRLKKPFLSNKNIVFRRKFCSRWILKSNEYWKRVIFTDESKFNLYNSDGCNIVWKEPKKRLDQKFIESTVKYGRGSVMVWRCFSSKGVGNLIFIDDITDRFLCLYILHNNL